MESNLVIKALGALAQETRLAIFRLLVERGPEGYAAGAIGEMLALPNATLSFHLKELATAQLIVAQPVGRSIIYSADFAAMNQLLAFLTENCCEGASCAPANASNCKPKRIVKRSKP
jgi:ArsR family transcriptional regulator, arsenate/arsenite/antimonite-responsive transcriptional repressor